ncbi:hypothetical protein HMPREF0495_02101 [Levilactobacillus brevis ATCC 14869 = DSM 20054]|uniref:Uncharacterized protein n=1 Tax=Levilactobacillus brevis ATCC 14869 = DSM 20054 TaxID=649758 RepID=U2PDG0_LEVBR|nr:hypothetical protein HMPREF0495_02101 [Levilactobacillus brevis ATCC 14869 = DSM 20054]
MIQIADLLFLNKVIGMANTNRFHMLFNKLFVMLSFFKQSSAVFIGVKDILTFMCDMVR